MSRTGIAYRVLTVGFDENDEPIKKRIGFSFSMNFWNELCKLEGISMSQVGDLFSSESKRMFETYGNVLYSAALAYAEVRDIEFNINKKLTGEWICEMPQEEFDDLINEMLNTRIFGKNLMGRKEERDQAAA
jgi:hypothetical protein